MNYSSFFKNIKLNCQILKTVAKTCSDILQANLYKQCFKMRNNKSRSIHSEESETLLFRSTIFFSSLK